MMSPNGGKPSIWKVTAAAAVGLFLSLPLHAQDDYLSAIEAEAENTQVLEQAIAEQEKLKKLTGAGAAKQPASQAQKPAAKKTASANNKPAKTSAGQKQFESELFSEFPGNFAVYSSLENSQKSEVYKAYVDASDKEGLMRFGPVLGKILDMAAK